MATIVYDFKLDDDGDLYIDPDTNDFVIAPSDRQNIKDILLSAPGWFKEFPLLGWNPYKRLNAKSNQLELNQSAKSQLQGDGFKVSSIDLSLSTSGVISVNVLEIERP